MPKPHQNSPDEKAGDLPSFHLENEVVAVSLHEISKFAEKKTYRSRYF
jgi:hypothetical protein